MRKKVAILGSTGSIGTQALEVLSKEKDSYEVILLSGYNNISLLKKQQKVFGAKKIYATRSSEDILGLKHLEDKDTFSRCDIVINGMSGLAGLLPSIAALEAGCKLATANKESIICGFDFLKKARDKGKGSIIPIDSEHSTIFRCSQGYSKEQISKLILTASGGAFRDLTKAEVSSIRANKALAHPTWKMGAKITIDSATLMNKGLEIIEAKYLFGISDIEVIGHRESIIHALIQLKDNSYIAGLSYPDMALPIEYALAYPHIACNSVQALDFEKLKALNFFKVDEDKFPCLHLAKEVAKADAAHAIVLNAANEVMVGAYLADRARFYDISSFVEDALEQFSNIQVENIDDIFRIDRTVREYTIKKVS